MTANLRDASTAHRMVVRAGERTTGGHVKIFGYGGLLHRRRVARRLVRNPDLLKSQSTTVKRMEVADRFDDRLTP